MGVKTPPIEDVPLQYISQLRRRPYIVRKDDELTTLFENNVITLDR
jgi:hypothetical protein